MNLNKKALSYKVAELLSAYNSDGRREKQERKAKNNVGRAFSYSPRLYLPAIGLKCSRLAPK
jgi:hypothetical protein